MKTSVLRFVALVSVLSTSGAAWAGGGGVVWGPDSHALTPAQTARLAAAVQRIDTVMGSWRMPITRAEVPGNVVEGSVASAYGFDKEDLVRSVERVAAQDFARPAELTRALASALEGCAGRTGVSDLRNRAVTLREVAPQLPDDPGLQLSGTDRDASMRRLQATRDGRPSSFGRRLAAARNRPGLLGSRGVASGTVSVSRPGTVRMRPTGRR